MGMTSVSAKINWILRPRRRDMKQISLSIGYGLVAEDKIHGTKQAITIIIQAFSADVNLFLGITRKLQ